MNKAIIVMGDMCGGPIISVLNQTVKVGGRNVIVVGDPVTPHGEDEHEVAVMIEGSPWYKLNGIPVCRQGDKASCGHTAQATQQWFKIA